MSLPNEHLGSERILITGGHGYAGAFFVPRFIARWGRSEDVYVPTSRELDLSSALACGNYLSQTRPTCLIFLATMPKSQIKSREHRDKNTSLFANLISTSESLRRVIFLSSVDVYGVEPRCPISEDTALCPDTYYAESKIASEKLLRVFDHIHDRTILRIPGLYGNPSSKRRNSVFDDLAQQCIEGGVRIDLEPENFRDWLSLDDLSRFVLGWACNQQVHDSSLRTFNLVSGNAWPVERWLRSVVQILGRKFEDTVFFERESVSKRAFDLVFDNTYLRKSYPTFIFGDRFQTLKNLVASFGVSTSSWERTQPSLAFSDDSQISEYMQ